MHSNGKSYSPGALLFLKQIREMREHVEFEKFIARTLVDNEDTQEFERKTAELDDKIYNLRFNNPKAKALTVAGKNKK